MVKIEEIFDLDVRQNMRTILEQTGVIKAKASLEQIYLSNFLSLDLCSSSGLWHQW